MLPENLRNLMHRFGFDVTRWPHRPDDGVLGWALDAVLRSREINCVIDVGGNRGALRGAAARGAGPGGLPPSVVAVLVELAAQPIYHDQPKMTEVMDILLDDGFTPVAFQPLF
jgi:hypothetical protein